MARPRSFDIEDALNTALNIFWQKGYRSASLDEIAAHCGLSKASLYAAFGDKKSFFLKVLDKYHSKLLGRLEREFVREQNTLQALSNWLGSFVPYCSSPRGKRGCLSLNASLDGNLEGDIGESIQDYNTQLERYIANQLEQNKAKFKKRNFDSAVAAYTVVTFYNGMMIPTRRRPSAKSLTGAIERVIRSIEE